MNKLLIGTSNPAKYEDYVNLLKDNNFELIKPKDLKIPEPEEKGKNFEENAVLKAKYYFEKSDLPTLVDDGGFEIDALNGEPGVKSHRWLGRKSSDEELIQEVIKRMEKTQDENRSCRMTVVIAVASPLGVFTSHAAAEGVVAKEPSNTRIKGYPYRSVMYLPNYGKYYCDLSHNELGEHEILNHRKAALEKIKDILVELSK